MFRFTRSPTAVFASPTKRKKMVLLFFYFRRRKKFSREKKIYTVPSIYYFRHGNYTILKHVKKISNVCLPKNKQIMQLVPKVHFRLNYHSTGLLWPGRDWVTLTKHFFAVNPSQYMQGFVGYRST